MASEIKYAPIYFDNEEILNLLSDAERGRLLMAILDFSEACAKGIDFELTDSYGLEAAGKIAFAAMTKGIERLYESLHVKKANGSKGGRPKAESNQAETDENLTITKENLTETEPKLNAEEKEEEEEEEKEYDEEEDEEYLMNSCIAVLPLRDGTEYPLTETMLKKLEPAYPNVDVRTEFLRMERWCLANPGNRKTRRGANRFVNGWLSREQDKARSSPRIHSNPFLDAAGSMEVIGDDPF